VPYSATAKLRKDVHILQRLEEETPEFIVRPDRSFLFGEREAGRSRKNAASMRILSDLSEDNLRYTQIDDAPIFICEYLRNLRMVLCSQVESATHDRAERETDGDDPRGVGGDESVQVDQQAD
jgi:hypothetical protein